MANAKDIMKTYGIDKCEFCGYNEYAICLTAHHIFQKSFFKQQPEFDRCYRYAILCPNCHVLLHKGIFVNNGLDIIMSKIKNAHGAYSNRRSIDSIIKLAKMVYDDLERNYKHL